MNADPTSGRRALILDLDGVLIDSEPLWCEAGLEVLARVGVALTPDQLAETRGMWIRDSIAYWYTRFPWSGPSVEQVMREWILAVIALVSRRAEPMPGGLELVKVVRAMGWPVAAASSSPLVYVRAALDPIGLASHFDAVHSAALEPYGKPHPALFLTTAPLLPLSV